MSSFADIINRKKKDWDCESLMDGALRPRGDKLPFSSPLMQYCTYGGIPRDRITEFFGENGGGKSTTAVDICKNAIKIFHDEYEQKVAELRGLASTNKMAASELEELLEIGPKRVLYIDLEHTFDGEWAKVLGIKLGDIDIMQPPDIVAEDILQTLLDLISTGEVGLAVLDSTPSLVPRSELENELGKKTIAQLAGLLTVFCRKVVPILSRYKCTLLMINQIRENMDNPYVIKTPGGQALKFYASLRIQFKIGSPIDFLGNELPNNAEDPSGYIINARIHKQKSAPNDRKNGSYYLMTQSGIREDIDYAQLAIKRYGIIKKGGAWFTVTDPFTGEVLESEGKIVKVNGIAKVYEYLKSNQEYFSKLKQYILSDIEGKDPSEVVGDLSADDGEITDSSDIL